MVASKVVWWLILIDSVPVSW